MEIKTKRLIMRKLSENNAVDLMGLWGNSEVIKFTYMPLIQTIEECKNKINEINDTTNENNDVGPFVIFENKELIGFCGIRKIAAGINTLFYQFKQEKWGNGYATEISNQLLALGFENKKMELIQAECVPENSASMRVLNKCGFEYVTKVEKGFNKHGIIKDLLRFEISYNKWLNKKLLISINTEAELNLNNVKIVQVNQTELKEILKLQILSYQSEAINCNDFEIPPLKYSIQDIENEFMDKIFFKAILKNKIIGSVRGFLQNESCYIEKLIVHPDFQNRGVGKKLILFMEEYFKECKKYELFTGNKSKRNIQFYEKLGYIKYEEKKIDNFYGIVFMKKEKIIN